MMGDGEMQEGSVWEALMYAGAKKISNLCILIDCNNGQLDVTSELLYETDINAMVESFGFETIIADATDYESTLKSLNKYINGKKSTDKPTAILCHTIKGFGCFSGLFNKHKLKIDEDLYIEEKKKQNTERQKRINDVIGICNQLNEDGKRKLRGLAESVGMNFEYDGKELIGISNISKEVILKKAPARNKLMDDVVLCELDKKKEYSTADIVCSAMEKYAKQGEVISIDSDLSSTSGLFKGVGKSAPGKALNVGIAETNMLNMAEGFAINGKNVWVSTFCPFFDLRAIRRISIGYQERDEVICGVGWLSEGHNVDITFLGSAPNLETQANGATHMGNDDITLFSQMAHLKIIDLSCPRLLQGVITWIMQGNKGLVYVRMLRAPSKVIYPKGYVFEYGKSHNFKGVGVKAQAALITSGRGVYEALGAQKSLEAQGIGIDVIDMASYDEDTLMLLYGKKIPLFFAEQNNGYLYSCAVKTLFNKKKKIVKRKTKFMNRLSTNKMYN